MNYATRLTVAKSRLRSAIQQLQETVFLDRELRSASDAAVAMESIDIAKALRLHEEILCTYPKRSIAVGRYVSALQRLNNPAAAIVRLSKLVTQKAELHFLSEFAGNVMPDVAHHASNAFCSKEVRSLAAINYRLARSIASTCVQAADYASATEFAAFALGHRCSGVALSASEPGKYSVRLDFEGSSYRATLLSDFLPWGWLLDRLLAYRPYLDRLLASGDRKGSLLLCVGDFPEGDVRQLCFSSRDPQHLLVPDPMFLDSDAYANSRSNIDKHRVPFRMRHSSAYWRGSLTGLAHEYQEIMRLPRVELSLLSRFCDSVDAKITDLSQFGPLLPTLQYILEGLDLCGPKEPDFRNALFRYLIDVDGNTNSWPGLWTKLYTGSVVIKLRSPWRQWYYDKLVHGKNVLFVDELSSDLAMTIDWCEDNFYIAEEIGKNGRQLASRMSPTSEFSMFESIAEQALS